MNCFLRSKTYFWDKSLTYSNELISLIPHFFLSYGSILRAFQGIQRFGAPPVEIHLLRDNKDLLTFLSLVPDVSQASVIQNPDGNIIKIGYFLILFNSGDSKDPRYKRSNMIKPCPTVLLYSTQLWQNNIPFTTFFQIHFEGTSQKHFLEISIIS